MESGSFLFAEGLGTMNDSVTDFGVCTVVYAGKMTALFQVSEFLSQLEILRELPHRLSWVDSHAFADDHQSSVEET